MEAHVAAHAGTFCFSRPIYLDGSLCPAFLEYGILIPSREVWWATFNNVPDESRPKYGRRKKPAMPPEKAGIPNCRPLKWQRRQSE